MLALERLGRYMIEAACLPSFPQPPHDFLQHPDQIILNHPFQAHVCPDERILSSADST